MGGLSMGVLTVGSQDPQTGPWEGDILSPVPSRVVPMYQVMPQWHMLALAAGTSSVTSGCCSLDEGWGVSPSLSLGGAWGLCHLVDPELPGPAQST